MDQDDSESKVYGLLEAAWAEELAEDLYSGKRVWILEVGRDETNTVECDLFPLLSSHYPEILMYEPRSAASKQLAAMRNKPLDCYMVGSDNVKIIRKLAAEMPDYIRMQTDQILEAYERICAEEAAKVV